MVAAQFATSVSFAIFTSASLSFLGLGIPPPAADWGGMVRAGYDYLAINPWMSLAPGAAVSLDGDGILRYRTIIQMTGRECLKVRVEVMAEGSAASIAGSRRALSRPRLRRLTALSRRSPQPVWPPWLRRSALGDCPGLVVAQDGVEDGQQLAHDGDEGEAGGFAGLTQTAVEAACSAGLCRMATRQAI